MPPLKRYLILYSIGHNRNGSRTAMAYSKAEAKRKVKSFLSHRYPNEKIEITDAVSF